MEVNGRKVGGLGYWSGFIDGQRSIASMVLNIKNIQYMSKIIKVKKSSMLKEHKKLVKVLKKGTRYARITEANKQKKELKKYK